MLADRQEAGRKLAEKLALYRGGDAVVYALPRGGVVLGYEVAETLALPLDIVAVRKIGHPFSPEYAIGVVDERGERILNEREAATVDQRWLETETLNEKREAQRRSRLYREKREPPAIAGKTAIIIDDGIATGLTMRLAVRAVREQGAKKIIVAVPVAPQDSLNVLKDEGADEFVVLEPPEHFAGAVGSHYERFEQVGDREVIELLRAAHESFRS